MTGCAVAALLTALPRAASAQSFNGSPSVVAGDALVTTGPGTTNVDVFLPETVINWSSVVGADPNAIDFQPAGTTATFTGGPNIGDYTVLNRILPMSPSGAPAAATVAFNGTVNSSLFNDAPGGNIWFYSPTGIIVGPTATFNVGSLILTTDDIQFVPGEPDISNGSIYGPGGLVQFRGGSGSTGLVDIQPGAKITADGPSSYVALVAPRVQQGGTVSANGPIGYIGAEQVDMTINAGLFDISILAGTTDSNGVVHTGTTTGPASTGYFDQQQIMMVAMPKATALTMLLSGSIGYAPAASAYDDGSSIVLSAGYSTQAPASETTDSLGKISIDDAAFSNPLTAYATGSIGVTGNDGPVSFAPYTNLFAQDAIDITLAAGQSLTLAGGLTASAGRTGKGGTIDVMLGTGASLTAASYIDLNASSNVVPFATAPYVNADGGTITVDVDGGTISSTGISGSASASAGYDPVLGGTARGGSVAFSVRNGGSIGGSGYLSALADAYGGSSDDAAGDAIAGVTSLTSDGGVLSLGSVYLGANAYAANGGNTSGAAIGGTASLLLDGGTYSWNNLTLTTDSTGSYSGAQGGGATGRADAIDVSIVGAAALTVTGSFFSSSDAYGSFNPAADSVVRGGGINLSVAEGSSLTFGNLTATAEAGINAPFFTDGASSTPDTVGGTITLTADSGTLSGQSAGLFADAYQLGALDNAGTAQGGAVAVNLLNGSSLTLTSGEGGSDLNLSASGFGALGDSAADAIGGSASLTISDSTVNVATTIDVAALARANDYAIFTPSGSNPTGFNATGGTATATLVSSSPGGASLTVGSLIVEAGADASTPEFYAFGGETFPSGYYGGPFQANGGTGTGGTATLNLGGGLASLTYATVSANGSGGISAASYSGTPFRSGDGRGGTAALMVTGGTNMIEDLAVSAVGYGGNGSPTGDVDTLPALAGDGFGGNATLTSSGGTLQADTLALDAIGYGGAGGDGPDDTSLTPATDGGDGTGGTARLVSTAGSTGTLTFPAFTIAASGIGGTGGDAALGPDGNGGNGIGGRAATQLADGAFSFGPVTLDADGTGGDGVTGGEGSGGTAQFTLIDTTGPSGARGLGALSLHASGLAGISTTGPVAATGAGSTGLDVEVSSPAATLVVNGDFEAISRGSLAAAGSGFDAKTSGGLFRVNGNINIDTARDVTIAANAPIFATGGFTSLSRSFTQTGLLSANGFIAITAPEGISAGQLRTDNGTTTLLATNGPITVSGLTSFGDVTALGRSIHISNGGRLIVASAQATAGDLFIHTGGNLILQSASATGAMDFAGNTVIANSALAPGGAFSASGTNGVTLVSLDSGGSATLTSANGAVSASGDVTSAGAFAASGNTGASFGSLSSGGTTSLTSSNGNVAVTNLTSVGLVTAIGAAVTLQGTGSLSFANAQATAGDLGVVSAGNLAFGQAGASGAVGLTSSAGSLTATGPVSAGGAVNLSGLTGLNLAAVSSGGTTSLSASNGAIVATDLTSSGDVTATGRSIDLTSSGALSFANAQAGAGNLRVLASGDLTFAQASATGTMNLTSSAGSLRATGPLTAGGAVALVGASGLSLTSLSSGGTTGLAASNGAILISELTSTGDVTASGRSVDLASSGALSVANAQATAGNLRILAAGNLTFGQASASGTVNLTSSAGSITASGPMIAGGAASLQSATDLTLTALASGGATNLSASNGAIQVGNLTSTGNVTATGRSIDIGSSGALSFANAQASAGNLRVIASGNLAFAQAGATGTIAMSSSAGSLGATGPISAGGAVNLFGATGLALGSLTSGGTTLINGGTGALTVTSLTSPGTVTALGGSLDIASPGVLTFSSIAANSGPARISTAGNLAIGDGTVTGALTLVSANGAISSSGTMTAGGAVSLNGKTGLDFNRLNAGGATSLVSASGPIRITRLASAGLVTANGTSIDIGSAEGLRFDTVASPGAVSISAAGDLLFNSVDAGGALTLDSTGGSLAATGALKGGSTLLSSADGITLGGDLTAGGPLGVDTRGAFAANGSTIGGDASVVADGGITMVSLQSGAITRLTASGGNVLIGDLDTSGQVSVTGLDVDIASSGSLTFNQAQATSTDLRLRTGGDLTGLILSANRDIRLAAGGTFRLTGQAQAANITVTSGDIAIGATARMGVRGTTGEIALFNGGPARETFIGGASQAGAYSLDSGEIARLFADEGISIGIAGSELSSDEGHMTVGDLALTFGTGTANIGSGGFLEISTPTEMSIVGNVKLTTASADDRFIIDPTRVELTTDTGSIAMLDAGSNPLGQLLVTGDTVAFGTAAALDQLSGLTDFAAINTLLDQPGGKADSLRAGTMAFNVADGLYIQNTGASTAPDDRRGFAANGLSITTASPSTRISINGVILQGGNAVTGLATGPLVTINGLAPAVGGQYDPLSTINGCALGTDCSLPPPTAEPDYRPPPNDELEPPVTPGNPGEGTLSGTLIQLQDNQPLISPPLVDEPITGVGNDDLWVPECPDGRQEGCPQQGEGK
jgi:hypothetical protein